MHRFYNDSERNGLRKRLRNEPTQGERVLWQYLKGEQLGVKFRCQYGVGPYVVDFYCASLRLAIELDGDSHFQPGAQERDRIRQRFIGEQGIRVIRFLESDVRSNQNAVLEQIKKNL